MNHLDLFTGIGGFHLAAWWAGFETIGFSEIESYCCKLLAQKWPGIKNYGDVRNTDVFKPLRGRVTVLSAGVPCQPSSLAGKRRGAADERWLWPATIDVVGLVKPAWCIFENPPGILSMGEFEGIILRLESLGYQVRAFSVPANAVGAKHLRERVFIVANACGRRCDRTGEGQVQQSGRTEAFSASEAMAYADGDERYRGTSAMQMGRIWSARETKNDGQLRSFKRLTQPPVCRRVDGIPNRSHRLRALGNAVVPAQAYPFFAAIAQAQASLK